MNDVLTPEITGEVPAPSRDDEPLYEIIDGQRVELPPMSAYAGIIGSRLSSEINFFARTQALGEAVVEVLFRLPPPIDRNRRPDVAFVSFKRWTKGRSQPIRDNAWDVVPDLAVEVLSPNDMAEALMEKLAEYFQAGVAVVWAVYPGTQIIHVYESLTRIRVLTKQDELDGGSVLPGFRLPLSGLFLADTASA